MRHALWNVNEEHGATIQRLSGSPVAMYALDLNPSILTEDAEFVYFGPYMQYMSGVTDTQVKWTLENRSDNPGIRDGDMFLANDPWVGAAHQMDVMLLCPVFWKGELFCWVTNCLHQYDIGGITPGSFCPSARDAFDEGILIPPVKIVENNEIRRDIEDVYLRSSRKPSAVALDFRAQLAGNITARDRILSLIKRYGAETVKGVMRKILDDGERAFLKKLAAPARRHLARPDLRRVLPARRPAGAPGDADAEKTRGNWSSRTKAPTRRPAASTPPTPAGAARSWWRSTSCCAGSSTTRSAARCATSTSIRRRARSTAPTSRPRCRPRRCSAWRSRSTRPTTCSRR